ncbi:hypothetical protein CCHR01_16242 [Colletotrichum chrysophilum]|uniref:C2H2-type domain-containing protein n=1 Tax=Colletotrichum chrysophilum TaxID=1836956 RepID=A0AAD9A4H8_9PEZI|nr:hypothetical protein CCHR01_16242 [Colletotrichum chrysophilum]
MNDTGHAIPQFECISCRRVCLSREALQQHQRDTGHLKVDKTPQIGAADIVSVQKTAMAESSGMMATVEPEKPHAEPETCNPVDLNGNTIKEGSQKSFNIGSAACALALQS